MTRHETLAEWFTRTDARAERLNSTPHFVYRVYDEYGLLLYVGCSVNTKTRMAAHRLATTGSVWARFYDHHTVSDPYPSMVAGRTAETAAIDAEKPFFNRAPGNQFMSTCELTPSEQESAYLAARDLAASGVSDAMHLDRRWLDAHARSILDKQPGESATAYLVRGLLASIERTLIESGCPLTDEQRGVFAETVAGVREAAVA